MHASRLQHDTTGMKVQRQRKSTTPAPMSYDAYLKLRKSLEIPPPPRRSPCIAPPWESQQWVPVFRESYLLKLDEELGQPTTQWETNQIYFSRESGRSHPYNRWEFGTEEEDDTDKILEKIGAALSASASASRASGSTQRSSRGRGPRSGVALPPSLLQKQSTGPVVASGRPSTSRNPSSSATRKGKGREAPPPEASSASRVGGRPSASTHLSSSTSSASMQPVSDRKGKGREIIPLAPSTVPNGGLERRPHYRPEVTATSSHPFVVYQQLPDARRPPIPQNDLQRHQGFGPGPSHYRPTANVAGLTRAPFSQTNVNSQPTAITTISPANFSQEPHFSSVNIIDGQLALTRMQFSQETYDLAKLEIMSRLVNGE
ncbi:hypothetical protein CPC08DRAFT_722207 [Agrocybe pediades]|nr:hypothetical protein CPC08DRAFT_722207 [Agrocybe pediades]